MIRLTLLTSLLLVLAAPAVAQQPIDAPLPPAIPWNGASRDLIAKSDDPWITPSEKSGFRTTPGYDETVAFLNRLVAAAPELRMISLGKSAEGRDVWMVIASKERAFTPEMVRRSGKPILFAQGGIHSGEIDGKDAGLMLLRDMTVGRKGNPPSAAASKKLLDRASFLFVPIFNVDGHERSSRFGRINQRGPETIGWRTNARNLNLNRDYTKIDAEEMRAMVAALDRWNPDLYLDLHVTDGVDYQYDITFGWNLTTGWSPEITRWMNSTLEPALLRDLAARGHIPGPLVFPAFGDDLSKGIGLGNAGARLSTGYGDARHIGTVLVENHSLKPYDQRVLGTVVLLQSALDTLGRQSAALRTATASDQRRRIDPIYLEWLNTEVRLDHDMEFLGVDSRVSLSPISGTLRREWLGKPVTFRVPVYVHTLTPASSASRPKAYWIPAAWTDVIERLKIHGIRMERIDAAREIEVEMYRIRSPKFEPEAFEGRHQIKFSVTTEKRKERFASGSYRVPMDQPLGTLAAVLLEPLSPDSFLKWGFFLPILQRTEYVEDYITEPLAEKMLASDPTLAAEFAQRIADDEAFRRDAEARLRFFYERTPYYDERWMLYPVGRER